MGESGSPRDHEPRDHDNGDLLQFGGLPVRWPFQPIRWPRAEFPIKIVLVGLAIGLLIGFFGGRLTAPEAAKTPRFEGVVSTPVIAHQIIPTAIAMTGARCAVQVGPDLQLGVEVMNKASSPVTLGSIFAAFPLGGLRAIAVGIGACGALPPTGNAGSGSLPPGGTQWIYTTVAVRKGCPEPLPVFFKVGYQSAGHFGSAVLSAFPDLGPVSYKGCSHLDSNSSSTSFVFVDPATGRSYRG